MIAKPPAPVRLSQEALLWALTHLRRFGDTVFLPPAFEYGAIHHDWQNVSKWLVAQDLREWTPRVYRRFLAAKTSGSFRYITQLDPLEHLAFAALMYNLGRELEDMRVPTAKRTVFAWRFSPKPDGTMYDPEFRWHIFSQHSRRMAERRGSKFVVVADIADFFAHLYLHPLERVLARCKRTSAQAYCVLRMLKGWNANVSYGVPVGPPASRILADSALVDLDLALQNRHVRYCRYSDDFRIFCRSASEARSQLEFLAEHLFEMYGLTLEGHKTLVLPADQYIERFTLTAERLEAESLEQKFNELLEEAGVEFDYDSEVSYAGLPEETRRQIDQLNLAQLFRDQLKKQRLDPIVGTLLLQRMAQLNSTELLEDVLTHMDQLEPIIDAAVSYVAALTEVSASRRRDVGRRIVKVVKQKRLSGYQTACLLSVFAKDARFDNERAFDSLYETLHEHGRRKLMLALGRAGKGYWFVARRRDLEGTPWLRRAFIAGASCMESDVRTAFFKGMDKTNHVLERAVLSWARAHPLNDSATHA